jgi:hypothetical protein
MWPTLLNWGMGGWMAAASAPVIIHLLSKRRYRKQTWAAMRFLLEAVKKTNRRIRIEQLLLLTIRTLLIALVLLAVMEPVTRLASAGGTAGDVRSHRLIVIDGSFSMGFEASGQTLFDRARRVASDIVSASGKGDGFTLIVMSDPPREIIRTPALDAQQVLDEIGRLTLTDSAADVGATLDQAEAILRRAAQDRPQLRRQEVYFVTDLGRATWTNQPPNEDTLRALSRRSEDARIHVIDLGLSEAENTAITGLSARRHFATLAEPMTLEARLQNFGRTTASSRRLELIVNGETVIERNVTLEPGIEQTVALEHRFRSPGDAAISVRISDDALPLDNERWLSLPVRDSIRVLLIDGKPDGDPRRGATGYLRAALDPGRGTQPLTVFRPEVRRETALVELQDLSPYDAVVLSNVQQLSVAEAERLKSYLAGGGGLMIFLGDLVRPESYNQFLGSNEQQGQNILPAKIGPLITARTEDRLSVDPLENEHPILEVFRGNERATLSTAPIRSYHRLSLPESGSGQVVAAVSNGDPLIVEHASGRGQVILLAVGADRDQSGLPILPTWLPLVHEMLGHVVLRTGRDANILVGEPIGGVLPASAAGTQAEIVRPNGSTEEIVLTTSAEGVLYEDSETTQAGIYRIRTAAVESGEIVFAVNVDPRESDLTKLSPEELRNEILPGLDIDYRTDAPDAPAALGGTNVTQYNWAAWLLYAALGLAVVETWLAYRFGHHTV